MGPTSGEYLIEQWFSTLLEVMRHCEGAAFQKNQRTLLNEVKTTLNNMIIEPIFNMYDSVTLCLNRL